MEGDSAAAAAAATVKKKAEALEALVRGPLAASGARLSAAAHAIPSGRDFHFYHNFPEFRTPARSISESSESSLRSIASSGHLWGSRPPPDLPNDLDDAYDWLVNLNDEFLERFGVSADEFKNLRLKEEEEGKKLGAEDVDNGFQLVYGKKNKKGSTRNQEREKASNSLEGGIGVKVASRDTRTTTPRSKVPFHIPSIPRPQDEFGILVNNANQPFEHVWLERSKDGTQFIHPLEKLSLVDFIDRSVGEGDPVKPLPIESTPFKLVEEVKDLKELVAKLRNVNEFAVDLEHNQYRSFQGLTCLMQVSTRTEDFIIDTLKLRIHVGPYLRELFKDPSKRKVMHGADRDIVWLQRDFGIYVCNLFDTGQASRVMQLERNSLEYLLHHYCGVNANKEYQNADWRLRPLPDEMRKYAREDTHYLLHIYDLMRSQLLSASSEETDLLIEVYKRSSAICMQLYEKELLTDTSFIYIYGLQEADFNSKQLAVAAALCEWRDSVARVEDESTGYILPNKTLLEIARQMPVSAGRLRRLVRSKHPFVERYLNSVIAIIRNAKENSAAFDDVAEQLKKAQTELPMLNSEAVDCESESIPAAEDAMEATVAQADDLHAASSDTDMQNVHDVPHSLKSKDDILESKYIEHAVHQAPLANKSWQKEDLQMMNLSGSESSFRRFDRSLTADMEKAGKGSMESSYSAKQAQIPSVQISKKSTSAFGVLLGNSFSRKKSNKDEGGTTQQHKNESKVEQIKSAVFLPFHSFGGGEKLLEPTHEEHLKHQGPAAPQQSRSEVANFEEIIPLYNGTHDPQSSSMESPMIDNGQKHRNPKLPEDSSCADSSQTQSTEEVPMSLSDLQSSFDKCLQEGPAINYDLKPFDYATARKTIKFGEVHEGGAPGDDALKPSVGSRRLRKGPGPGQVQVDDGVKEFPQPRRSQAFPQSGNRSTTFH